MQQLGSNLPELCCDEKILIYLLLTHQVASNLQYRRRLSCTKTINSILVSQDWTVQSYLEVILKAAQPLWTKCYVTRMQQTVEFFNCLNLNSFHVFVLPCRDGRDIVNTALTEILAQLRIIQ